MITVTRMKLVKNDDGYYDQDQTSWFSIFLDISFNLKEYGGWEIAHKVKTSDKNDFYFYTNVISNIADSEHVILLWFKPIPDGPIGYFKVLATSVEFADIVKTMFLLRRQLDNE